MLCQHTECHRYEFRVFRFTIVPNLILTNDSNCAYNASYQHDTRFLQLGRTQSAAANEAFQTAQQTLGMQHIAKGSSISRAPLRQRSLHLRI